MFTDRDQTPRIVPTTGLLAGARSLLLSPLQTIISPTTTTKTASFRDGTPPCHPHSPNLLATAIDVRCRLDWKPGGTSGIPLRGLFRTLLLREVNLAISVPPIQLFSPMRDARCRDASTLENLSIMSLRSSIQRRPWLQNMIESYQ